MKRKILLLVVCIAAILIIAFLINQEMLFPPKLHKPLSWKSITPGETFTQDVEHVLGTADERATHKGFSIYGYEDRKDLGWKWVEIWYKDQPIANRVQAIFLSSPYEDDIDFFSLESLVKIYGKPNFVTWSSTPYLRYVCWSKQGVAVNVRVDPHYPLDRSNANRIKTRVVLLFQPMTVRELKSIDWPWRYGGSWAFSNQFPVGSHTPDELPRDPFDWSKLIP